MGYCQKTVGCWLHRFNRSGQRGLDDLDGQGRKRRITEEERSRIISLGKTVPPGRLRWEPVGELRAFDESGPPEWTLNSLAAVARAEGIAVGRSQVCRILPARLVTRRPPVQSGSRLQPRTGEDTVEYFPQSHPRRPVIRQPRRHRTRHHPCNQPAQLPHQPLDPGQTRTANPPTTAPICVHRLRNPAVATCP
ncbi:helix-turn-helix domain-containing protein [Streptomyces sp. NPDC059837]|uniref:helix-turn-helix domain-containing protein n=1 Tax=unclassified Streptomyces TaxID=2593676 RepID=UPI002254F658|nr:MULTISPECIES: helix-turn-helix domain-containing protein [unclassified Streptomyces]MCX4403394.1 helix-turn-helix domain-containing protein [Streptomyces sp. NBC_01764]MCX5181631.1 helix-turn-helix domain-containing protein [Streptomyces sp. NBC_00268]